MKTYYDSVTHLISPIEDSTLFYLIKVSPEICYIKATSSGLDKLTRDPATGVREYLLINSSKLLNDESIQSIYFPNDELVRNPLLLTDVCNHLALNLDDFKKFSSEDKQEFPNYLANDDRELTVNRTDGRQINFIDLNSGRGLTVFNHNDCRELNFFDCNNGRGLTFFTRNDGPEFTFFDRNDRRGFNLFDRFRSAAKHENKEINEDSAPNLTFN